jgi:hypothetical protein
VPSRDLPFCRPPSGSLYGPADKAPLDAREGRLHCTAQRTCPQRMPPGRWKPNQVAAPQSYYGMLTRLRTSTPHRALLRSKVLAPHGSAGHLSSASREGRGRPEYRDAPALTEHHRKIEPSWIASFIVFFSVSLPPSTSIFVSIPRLLLFE